jgi:hypothetical protein
MTRCLLPGYNEATEEEQIAALREYFQRVFTTEDGRIVLNALLADLFFFQDATTDAQKALSEYAKYFIRERLGITNTLEITDAMVKTMTDRKDRP